MVLFIKVFHLKKETSGSESGVCAPIEMKNQNFAIPEEDQFTNYCYCTSEENCSEDIVKKACLRHYESSQKYKEGKFIIELAHMIKENGWENESWK